MATIEGKEYKNGSLADGVNIVMTSYTDEMHNAELKKEIFLGEFSFKVIDSALYYKELKDSDYKLIDESDKNLQFNLYRMFRSLAISHIVRENS